MKKYAFIDMHIHSIFSNEEGCEQTPEKILDKALEVIEREAKIEYEMITHWAFMPEVDLYKRVSSYYRLETEEEHALLKQCFEGEDIGVIAKNITEHFTRACISITDHNSVLGSVEAMKLIESNPEKYANIDFIPGIEFNASLKAMGTNEQGRSAFSKCHMLAYNFDIKNEELILFSELFQLTIGKHDNINVGQTLCAARHVLKNDFGIDIPLKNFRKAVTLAKKYQFASHDDALKCYNNLRVSFFNYIAQNVKDKQILNEIETALAGVFPWNMTMVEKNAGLGKLSIKEISDIVENAGGVLSLAHPTLVSREKKTAKNGTELYDILEDFTKRYKTLTGRDLFAIEAFHPDCSQDLGALLKFAKDHDMYVTGGSDNHGNKLHVFNKMSRCFGKFYEFNSVWDPHLYGEQVKNRIVCLAVVDEFKNKQFKHHDKQFVVVKKADGQLYDKFEIIKISKKALSDFIKHKNIKKLENATLPKGSEVKPQKLTDKQKEKVKRDYMHQNEDQLGENLKYYRKQWRKEYISERSKKTEKQDKDNSKNNTKDESAER
ncbi:MAG: hypothetical protein IJA69_04520 [Clostridia bacterium]|nr:hypothetical protein [Clostridia bacterium]